MKILRILGGCVLGCVAGISASSEWIVETPAVFVATGRFVVGSDGTDVVVIDKSEGLARVGTRVAGGDGYRWEERGTGLAPVTGFAVLRGGSVDRWVATSPSWNALQYVVPGQAPEVRASPVAAPRVLARVSWGQESGAAREGVAAFSDEGETSGGGRMGVVGEDRISRFDVATDERFDRVRTLSLGPDTSVPVVVGRHAGGLRIGRADSDGWGRGAFDIVVGPGGTGGGGFLWTGFGADVFVNSEGEAEVRQYRLAGVDLGGGYRLAAGVERVHAHRLPEPVVGLDSVSYRDALRPGAKHVLVVRLSGSPDVPRFYRVEGSPPVLVAAGEAVVPAGESFVGSIAVGDDFLVLSGANGSVATWTRYAASRTDGSPEAVASGTVPRASARGSVPNLFRFDRDPFLDAASVFLGSERLGDWTSVTGGSVFGESDRGSGEGLGPASPLGVVGVGSVMLGNQLLPEASVAGFGPVGGVTRDTVSFEPPPGAYAPLSEGRRFRVEIRGVGAGAGEIRYRRSGDNDWRRYDPAVAVELEGNDTVLAYRESSGGAGRSRLGIGGYRFGALPSVEPVGSVDADGDRLPDAWERAFAVEQPGGDTDGDGATALEEFEAGTDPTDPESRPSGGGGPAVEVVVGRGDDGRIRMEWGGPLGGQVLEASDDLRSWQAVTPQPSENAWSVGVEGAGRFFRLRRR